MTAYMADGRTWYAMSMSGSEFEYNNWLAQRTAADWLESYSHVIAADWGPVAPGCATFDAFDVDVYEQRNSGEGLNFIQTVTTSYGTTLATGLLGPISHAPISSFEPAKARDDLELAIQLAVDQAAAGDLAGAMNTLQLGVVSRVDGIAGGDPSNDVVDDPDLQQSLFDTASDFIDALQAAETACGS